MLLKRFYRIEKDIKIVITLMKIGKSITRIRLVKKKKKIYYYITKFCSKLLFRIFLEKIIQIYFSEFRKFKKKSKY